MADQKISQLQAAAALTGAELIELVQGGVNVQSTAATLAPAATPGTVIAAQNAYKWCTTVWSGNSGVVALAPNGPANSGGALNWTLNGTGPGVSASFVAPAATTMYGVADFPVVQTAAIVSRAAEMLLTQWNAYIPTYRKLSGGLAMGGFTLVFYGGFESGRSDQTAFIGLGGNTAFGNSAVPSAQLDAIGFGKDQGDVNLQFMVNGGSGSAAKTDTGVIFTSLQQHLLKITLTCDAAGALITATIQDLEAGGFGTKTYTVADGAAKNVTADAQLNPHLYIGTGSATATLVKMAVKYFYINGGFA